MSHYKERAIFKCNQTNSKMKSYVTRSVSCTCTCTCIEVTVSTMAFLNRSRKSLQTDHGIMQLNILRKFNTHMCNLDDYQDTKKLQKLTKIDIFT